MSADSGSVERLLGATGRAGAEAEVLEVLQSMEMTLPELEGLTMHMVSETVEVGGAYDITAPDSDSRTYSAPRWRSTPDQAQQGCPSFAGYEP